MSSARAAKVVARRGEQKQGLYSSPLEYSPSVIPYRTYAVNKGKRIAGIAQANADTEVVTDLDYPTRRSYVPAAEKLSNITLAANKFLNLFVSKLNFAEDSCYSKLPRRA